MRKVRFTKDHLTYKAGEEVEVDVDGIADAFVNWAQVAVFTDEPKPKVHPPVEELKHDKLMKPHKVARKTEVSAQ